jgi:glycyl-tRNA synthetase
MSNLMDKVISLCKRRGFIFPDSEIYGGLANTWDFGPLGVELKNNIKKLWWERFVHRRDDIFGIESALIMNPRVWEASGHRKEFFDWLVECEKCHKRFRRDDPHSSETTKEMGHHITEEHPEVGSAPMGFRIYKEPKKFNLMFKTFFGSVEDESATVYLRPETAQGMFVNFKNILDTMRPRLPFGVAQIGKAFRNEITPGNFVFRTREFEMMEIEYFVRPPKAVSRTNADSTRKGAEQEEWEKWFTHWEEEMRAWLELVGINEKKIHFTQIPKEELAHYSQRTIDIEYEYPFGQKELYGLAYRTDFDLKNHEKVSGQSLKYRDPDTGEEFLPHVIEPTWGVERTVLAVLLDSYDESDPERVVLKLKPHLAPYKAAVFPLLANKPELIKKAKEVYSLLATHYSLLPVAWDERGNIGKRYYSQDEIGTPYCITVDFESLEKNDVTVRDRDTAKQERVKIGNLTEHLFKKLRQG